MGRGKAVPADPAARAERAAQECRAATREAHEAMQGMTEAADRLRAAIAEAERFLASHTTAVVAAEVQRRVEQALGPALEQALRAAAAPAPSSAPAAEHDGSGDEWRRGPQVVCPHCGRPSNGHTPMGEGEQAPIRGSLSACTGCWGVSVFDTNPLGDFILRTPTTREEAGIAGDLDFQRMVAEARLTSVPIRTRSWPGGGAAAASRGEA